MKLLGGIFGRKADAEDTRSVPVSQAASARTAPAVHVDSADPVVTQDEFYGVEGADQDAASTDQSAGGTIENVIDTIGKPRQNSVNIWDIEEDEADAGTGRTAAEPVAAPDAASARARRNRTRLIGFDTSQGEVVDLFEDSNSVRPSERVQFPVGWILVIEGPGRGHCFALTAGMAQIGRAEDQAIQLDFGDSAVSRNNHAAIVFDPESQKFLLGHGGKANIVRLNGKPVISNEDLEDGDKISIGETVLQLKTLVGEDFSWDETTDEGDQDDDVAIA